MTNSNEASLQLFLDRLTSRSVLTSQEQEAILGLPGRQQIVSTNNDFIRLGEQVDHASLIVSGLVGRFEQTAGGGRQITNFYIGGDMPDVHGIVQPTAPSALQALSSATVFRVPHSALRQAAAKYPGVAEALWRDCVIDLLIHAQWVVNVGRRDARTRIAHLLCEMACRSRARVIDRKVVFHLPLTQTHLADATGLTPVHVNRCLKALEKVGVMFRGKTVRIDDWEALTRLAGFDRGYLQERSGSNETPRMAAMSAS